MIPLFLGNQFFLFHNLYMITFFFNDTIVHNISLHAIEVNSLPLALNVSYSFCLSSQMHAWISLEFYVCFMSDDELKKLYIYLFILFYFYKKIAFFYAMNNNAIEHLFIYLLLISQYVWFTRSNVFFCDNFFHHGNPKKIVM